MISSNLPINWHPSSSILTCDSGIIKCKSRLSSRKHLLAYWNNSLSLSNLDTYKDCLVLSQLNKCYLWPLRLEWTTGPTFERNWLVPRYHSHSWLSIGSVSLDNVELPSFQGSHPTWPIVDREITMKLLALRLFRIWRNGSEIDVKLV